MIAKIYDWRQQALYPALYPWLVLLASLDVLVTWFVLGAGGREMNLIARGVIDAGGLPGMALFKAVMIGLILAICEYVGRREPRTGERLAVWAVVANTVAVTLGCIYLSQYWFVVLVER